MGGGKIQDYYEPETLSELEDLARRFYSQNLSFDIIGHTSNIYFTSEYKTERMVSTRKLNRFSLDDTDIYTECGTSVRRLANACVEAGIAGYEGLVDLPGTVAASLYGNASCYGCSIAANLIEAQVLCPDGKIVWLTGKDFRFENRSSVFKRGEQGGVILAARLKKTIGDKQQIQKQAESNHQKRKSTEPEPNNSLGSIFADSGKPTLLHQLLRVVGKMYDCMLLLLGNNQTERNRKKKRLTFALLGAKDVEPYVKNWNWYQWSDERSHDLFWKYVRLHRMMFTRSDFEIIIKSNP